MPSLMHRVRLYLASVFCFHSYPSHNVIYLELYGTGPARGGKGRWLELYMAIGKVSATGGGWSYMAAIWQLEQARPGEVAGAIWQLGRARPREVAGAIWQLYGSWDRPVYRALDT